MKNAKEDRPLGIEFGLAASSAIGAVIITNPIDVIKVRLQLQGELLRRGSYNKLYKNTFHAGYVILKNEGIRGLQAGLVPAFGFQIALNGIRIGSYKCSRTYGFTLNEKGESDLLRTALVSGTAGCSGAILGSPFYLVKTRMQSQAAETIAVGHQHGYASPLEAFRQLWREGGVSGLYQRWYANAPRTFIGSATQLTMFSFSSDLLRPFHFFGNHPLILTFFSALIGGSSLALITQPLDVISVRLYNQATDGHGKALVYRGISDAFIQILKKEGIFGLYKGLFPTWMRSAPHTVLCLCFYEQFEKLLGIEFGLAAFSAIGAVTITNPIDVIKVRLILQGELLRPRSYEKLYKNTFHAGYVILQNEGIRGAQAGLLPAFGFQIILNGIRIGSYKFSRTYGFTLNEKGESDLLRTALVSGTAGCAGVILGSPFYLVKIRMQSQAAETIVVGHQHGYASPLEAFRQLWKQGGVLGLYQRWYVNTPQVFIGSATQLTMFTFSSDLLQSFHFFKNHPLILTFFSALIGGTSMALINQPLDVISVRLHNQVTDGHGKGLVYRGIPDAFIQILKKEGIFGLYKGFFPTWIRAAPHTVLCLCFYEQLQKLYDSLTS